MKCEQEIAQKKTKFSKIKPRHSCIASLLRKKCIDFSRQRETHTRTELFKNDRNIAGRARTTVVSVIGTRSLYGRLCALYARFLRFTRLVSSRMSRRLTRFRRTGETKNRSLLSTQRPIFPHSKCASICRPQFVERTQCVAFLVSLTASKLPRFCYFVHVQ